jgi:hypothetical protein
VPAPVGAQLAAAVLACLAAVGYLRRPERLGGEFSGWLAVASHIAAIVRKLRVPDRAAAIELFRGRLDT